MDGIMIGTKAAETKSDISAERKVTIDRQFRTSGLNGELAPSRIMAVNRVDCLPEDKHAQAYDRGAQALRLFVAKALCEAVPTPKNKALTIEGRTGYLAGLIEPIEVKSKAVTVDEPSKRYIKVERCSLRITDTAVAQPPSALFNCLQEWRRIVSDVVLRQVTRIASGRKVVGQVIGQVSLQAVEDLGISILHDFDTPKKWTFL